MIPTVPLETLMINVLAAKIVIILIQTHYVKHLLKDVTMLMENVSCKTPFVYDSKTSSCKIDGCQQYFLGGC